MEKWFTYTDPTTKKVVGRMCVTLIRRDYRHWEFHSGWVHHKFRRKGIWSKLWRDRLKWTLEQNPRFIEGWCTDKTKRYYIDAGFVEIGTEGDWYHFKFMPRTDEQDSSTEEYSVYNMNFIW